MRTVSKLTRRFCQQKKEDAKKLKEALRKDEQKLIEERIHKKSSGFSTLNRSVVFYRKPIFKMIMVGGIFAGLIVLKDNFTLSKESMLDSHRLRLSNRVVFSHLE